MDEDATGAASSAESVRSSATICVKYKELVRHASKRKGDIQVTILTYLTSRFEARAGCLRSGAGGALAESPPSA